MTDALPWKTAWVTGASTGIGRDIVLQLKAAGVNVAASARSAEKLSALGPDIVTIPLDVTDAAACHAAVERIESELGPLDLVVFGAGTYAPVAVDSIDPQLFAHTMNTNYMGVVNCLAAVAPRMLARGSGHISWIASVAGFLGLPKAAAYGPTKAALINLAECLEPEMKLKGVRISERSTLRQQLSEALAHPGPAFIEVQVRRNENCYPMVPPGASNAQMVGLPSHPELAIDTSRECHSCHHTTSSSSLYCPNCGTKL